MKFKFVFILPVSIFLLAFSSRSGAGNQVAITSNMSHAISITDTLVKPSQPTTDQQFLTTIYNTGLLEVKSAKLARRMTSERQVRKYAVTTISKYTAMNKSISTLMIKKGYEVPTKLPSEMKSEYKYLNGWMGDEFDQKYKTSRVNNREDAIVMFTGFSRTAKDADIRQFAAETLPGLYVDCDSARALLTRVKPPSNW